MVVSIAEQMLADLLAQEEQERLNRYKAAWDAYYCRFEKPLKVKRDKPDDNVLVGLCRLVVDKGVAFLFGKEVRFELPKEEDGEASVSERSEPEAWLDEVWNANRKQTTLQKWALNGAVCGHAWLKIVDRKPYPRIIVLDPANVRADHAHDDIDDVYRFVITYSAVDERSRKVKFYRQRIERDDSGLSWTVVDEEVEPPNKVWRQVGTSTWPHPFPPIVHCQNLPMPNEFYGLSDLEADVVGLNKAINFALSNNQAIIRYHAHPKVWGRGFTGAIETAADGTIIIPSPEGMLQMLEMKSDLSASIAHYLRLKEVFHEVAGLPEVATGKMENVGQLSGRALQILYRPLIDRTEAKRLTYGDALRDLHRALLVLGGFGEMTVDNVWPELVPSDPKEEAETLLLHEQLGVSQDTLVGKLGYNAEEERAKREAEAEANMRRQMEMFDSGEGFGGRDRANNRPGRSEDEQGDEEE